MPSTIEFVIPSQREIVAILRKHKLVKLREQVKRAYLVGSFAKGCPHENSDVDILLEVAPKQGVTPSELEDTYRQALRQYFVAHNIQGIDDSIHPNWGGRRVDLYFTYDADVEVRPKIALHP